MIIYLTARDSAAVMIRHVTPPQTPETYARPPRRVHRRRSACKRML